MYNVWANQKNYVEKININKHLLGKINDLLEFLDCGAKSDRIEQNACGIINKTVDQEMLHLQSVGVIRDG